MISFFKQRKDFILGAVCDYGLPWILRRCGYELQLRAGLQRRRFPIRRWREGEIHHWTRRLNPGPESNGVIASRWKSERGEFFFSQHDFEDYKKSVFARLPFENRRKLIAEADGICTGQLKYFFSKTANLGTPPDWLENPFSGGRCPSTHWSNISMIGAKYGDIKFVWEASRFSAAYTLARAYAATGDEKYPEAFWRLVESWNLGNPPNLGPNWKCGQEAALRLMAWAFALVAFERTAASTPDRIAMMMTLFAAQADRIEKDRLYSHLQRNNHSISEAVGLYLTGVLFPNLDRSKHWRRLGLKILYEEGIRLIKPEGTFSQKSHNYHRLMLHDMLYARRLADVNGDRFSDELNRRLSAASDYLLQVTDEVSGKVPNFGSNDGALVFPVTTCDYQDFRPVVGSANYVFNNSRSNAPGPWDEELFWLCGNAALQELSTLAPRVELEKQDGGIFTLRDKESWGFTHCETFSERPSQADCLHFDLWWKGQNIALDPGTYLYYGENPWNNGLQGTAVHNTVCVEGQDQLRRGSRFMWTHWHSAWMRKRAFDGTQVRALIGGHDGYTRLPAQVIHKRAVLSISSDTWLVLDELSGRQAFRANLQWLLADYAIASPLQTEDGAVISMETPEGIFQVRMLSLASAAEFTLTRASENSCRGWSSRYYGSREPALSLQLAVQGDSNYRFATVFAPTLPELTIGTHQVVVQMPGGEALRVELVNEATGEFDPQVMRNA